MLWTNVAIASSLPSRLPSSSSLGPSYISPLPVHGDTVSEDLKSAMDLIWEQRDADTRFVASCLPYLESVRNDLAVASAAVIRCSWTVVQIRSENSQLWKEVSGLTPEVGSSRTLCNGFDVSRRRLVDCDAKIDSLRIVLTLVCEWLDGGLGGLDSPS